MIAKFQPESIEITYHTENGAPGFGDVPDDGLETQVLAAHFISTHLPTTAKPALYMGQKTRGSHPLFVQPRSGNKQSC